MSDDQHPEPQVDGEAIRSVLSPFEGRPIDGGLLFDIVFALHEKLGPLLDGRRIRLQRDPSAGIRVEVVATGQSENRELAAYEAVKAALAA